MRTPIPFDTHAYVKRLIAAGVPEPQAEVHAQAFVEVVIEQLATKQDLALLGQELRAEIEKLRAEMQAEFQKLRGEMQAEFRSVRGEIQQLRAEMQAEFRSVRGEIQSVRGEFQTALKDLELRLTIRMGAMLVAAVAAVAALVKLMG